MKNFAINASTNVLILGAGASFDAGLPLMSNLVSKLRGRSKKVGPNQQIYAKAIRVLEAIEQYCARSNIDITNIEDVLSVLSIEEWATGKNTAKNDVSLAIAKLIDEETPFLPYKFSSGIFTHAYKFGEDNPTPNIDLYHNFWRIILDDNFFKRSDFPTIISFNYDLIFELSMLWFLQHGVIRESREHRRYPYTVAIDYQENFPAFLFSCVAPIEHGKQTGMQYRNDITMDDPNSRHRTLTMLKLHGSLNFDSKYNEKSRISFEIVDNPQILPPVFNKADMPVGKSWNAALSAIQGAQCLTVVGYSFPETDTYFRYFLKAAIGGCKHLERVNVFDPAAHNNGSGADEYKTRVKKIFSESYRSRIHFPTKSDGCLDTTRTGTFQHFVQELAFMPQSVFNIEE